MNKKASLRALVNEFAFTDFSYGLLDCCQFVAKHIENVRNVSNPAMAYVYSSERGADKLVEQSGGLEQIVCKELGAPSDGILAIGDICLLKLPLVGLAIAIRSSGGVIMPGKHGLWTLPGNCIVKGWVL